MVCRAELGELGPVAAEISARGGHMLAITVDTAEHARALVTEKSLGFDVLTDADRTVTDLYGLRHEHGGPGGSDIAIPAQFLVRPDGTIAWRHVATRVTDRATPAETIAAIRAL